MIIQDDRVRGDSRIFTRSPIPKRFRDLVRVRIHMSNARDFGIVNVPLQGVPPGKGRQTTPNHQLTLERICSSLPLLLFGHTLLDVLAVQVGYLHPDTTASPLFRLYPTIVSHDVALEVGNAPVLLDVVASDDGALEVGFLADQPRAIFTLEVARGDITLIRMQTAASSRRSNALLGSGGSRTGGREGRATGRLVLGGGLALLLLLGRGCLGRMVLFVVIRGRDIVGVPLIIRFGTTTSRGRGG